MGTFLHETFSAILYSIQLEYEVSLAEMRNFRVLLA